MTEATQKNSWITCPKPNPQARLRLFCMPYAGGGASAYRTWVDHLPVDIEVCPIQLPGRESRLREPPFTQLVPLVQSLAQALRPYLDLPYAFFGHSMGALISFQLARYLRREQGCGPRHLFVSSNDAPQLPRHRPPIHQLPEAEFVEAIRLFQGTPEAVLQDAELRQLLLPLLRADCALLETYVYIDEEPLKGPISAFGGWQDAIVSYAALDAWRDQTRGSFTLRMFPGHHFYLHNVRTLLLQDISKDLQHLLRQITTSSCL